MPGHMTLTLSLAGKNSHSGATENNTRLLPFPQEYHHIHYIFFFMVMVHHWLFIQLQPMPPRSLRGLCSRAGLGPGWTPANSPTLLQLTDSLALSLLDSRWHPKPESWTTLFPVVFLSCLLGHITWLGLCLGLERMLWPVDLAPGSHAAVLSSWSSSDHCLDFPFAS